MELARRRIAPHVLLLALVSTLAAPVGARAEPAAYYLAPGGGDAGPGTIEAPWGTFTASFAKLLPGDTLYVRGGTYAERVLYPRGMARGLPEARITVTAYPGERPVLRGILWLQPYYWTVSGINLSWNSAIAPNTPLVKLRRGIGWEFLNAELSRAPGTGSVMIFAPTADDTGEPSNWRFAGNCVHDTVPTRPNFTDHNMYVMPGLHAGPGIIERNILYGARNGFNIKFAGPGPLIGGASNIVVRYNTLARAATGAVVAYRSHHISFYRNLIGPRLGGTTWYPAIRGTYLTGRENRAWQNVGWGVARVVLNTYTTRGILAGRSNFKIGNPGFDSMTCGGFHPSNPVAQAYGRWAGL